MSQIISAASLLILLESRALHCHRSNKSDIRPLGKTPGCALHKPGTYPNMEVAYAFMHVIWAPWQFVYNDWLARSEHGNWRSGLQQPQTRS